MHQLDPDPVTSTNEAPSMTRRNEAVRTAAGCLAGYTRGIERAYEESAEFRSICAGLLRCTRAIAYWQTKGSHGASGRVQEYRALSEELKQEVIGWLDTRGYLVDDTPDPPAGSG